MSEAMSTPAANCANCGAPLTGPFCAACGQADRPLDPPVRHFAKEFTQELLDVDGRVPRTFGRLFFSPGFLTRQHVEGRRAPWLSPLRLYLLTSVAAFTALAFAGTDAGLRIAVQPHTREQVDASWVQAFGYQSVQELGDAIAAARDTWIPRVMFLLVPLFAGLVALVRRGAGRHYPAHLVFALHVHAAAFGARAAATAVGLALPASAARWLDTAVLAYVIGYAYLAIRAVYGGSRLRAAVDLGLVGLVYWVAVLICAGAAVLTAALGLDGLAKLLT
jgi:hypothetical protein